MVGDSDESRGDPNGVAQHRRFWVDATWRIGVEWKERVIVKGNQRTLLCMTLICFHPLFHLIITITLEVDRSSIFSRTNNNSESTKRISSLLKRTEWKVKHWPSLRSFCAPHQLPLSSSVCSPAERLHFSENLPTDYNHCVEVWKSRQCDQWTEFSPEIKF